MVCESNLNAAPLQSLETVLILVLMEYGLRVNENPDWLWLTNQVS